MSERLYIQPYLTRAQTELLRRVLDEAAFGYAESNPVVKLLRKIEKEQAAAWPEDRRDA